MILGLLQEAQHFKLGSMQGLTDLAICHRLRVPKNPIPPRVASVVRWLPPPPGSYKINVDGSTEGGMIYAGCVVCNSLRYFVAALPITLGRGIALDAEVLVGMHGVFFARARG